MASLLEVQHLSVRHPRAEHDALRDVSLSVQAGEVVALLGPNGCGKSTLLAACARVLLPRSGERLLDGSPFGRIRTRAFARRVAYLPQNPSAAVGLRVEELATFGRACHIGRFGVLSRADRHAALDALEAVEMLELRSRPLESLSGGERRRAWIAMVLAQAAELLLLDEPTAALDLRHEWQVIDLLSRANRERGVAIVISLHDLTQALRLADRAALLHRGRIYDGGRPSELLGRDALLDVFAIDAEIVSDASGTRVSMHGPADPSRGF
jgi:iron complex transport system ATP-binding protein